MAWQLVLEEIGRVMGGEGCGREATTLWEKEGGLLKDRKEGKGVGKIGRV